MTVFILLLSLLYALVLCICAISLLIYRSPVSDALPMVTIILPARNEASRIMFCLDALIKQTYPRERFEVIVIDDRSRDKTAHVARSYSERLHAITVLRVEEGEPNMAPKKFAIATGIRAAKGNIILCTDADCRPEPKWIESMVACFTDSVGMVIGYSPVEPKRKGLLLERFVALDSLALASIACATTVWNKPATATGRSLAYRREVFEEVGGFQSIGHFVSGDDDLLLQLVRKTKWRLAYCIHEGSLVMTDPPASYRQFINQKIRQASKGRHYTPATIALLILVYAYNLALITWVPWEVFHGKTEFALAWIMKWISDFALLAVGGARFHRMRFLIAYPVIALLHPLYIVVFGAWGQFGKFEWKDQDHVKHLEGTGT